MLAVNTYFMRIITQKGENMHKFKIKFLSALYDPEVDPRIEGTVIDYISGNFTLRKYGFNEYGVYDCEDVQLLSLEEFDHVVTQPTFIKRVEKLHTFISGADYISSEAINHLNTSDEEDILDAFA